MLLAPSPRKVRVSPARSPRFSLMVSRSARSWHGWKSSESALTTGTVVPAAISSRPGLRVGAPDDRRDHPLEHAGGVGRGLLAAQLAVGGRDDQRAAAEVGDPDGERDAGAGRRLVEDHRDRLRAGERLGAEAVALELVGQLEDLGLLGGGDVVVAQEVPGHESLSFGRCDGRGRHEGARGRGRIARGIGELGVADDERRGEPDARLVRGVDDEAVRRARHPRAGAPRRSVSPMPTSRPWPRTLADQRRVEARG